MKKICINIKSTDKDLVKRVLEHLLTSFGAETVQSFEEADILVSDDISLMMKALSQNEDLIAIEYLVADKDHKSGLSSDQSSYYGRVHVGRVVTDNANESLMINLLKLMQT